MAKVDCKSLDKIFNEMNKDIKEELSEYDHWDDDWRNDELYLSDDDVMFGYHDYDCGDL